MDPNGLAEQTGREEEKPSEAHELIMGDHNQALQPDPQLQTTPSTVNHHTKSHRSHKKPERRWPAHLIWIASTVLWFIGFRILYFPESDIAVVGALALSAFVLRGPRVRYGLIVWVCGAGIFTLQLVKIAGSAYGVISNYSAPVYLLEATLAGVIAVGIAMCLLVTWIPKWPFAESLAVGVVAIFLGVLCLPGLQAVTKTLTVPSSNGTGLWFVKGTEDQRIAPKIDLYAYTTPLSTSRPHEELDIWNDSSQPIRWALLLVGNAMLIPGTISENQIWRSGEYGPNYSIFVGSPESVVPTPAPGQLFSGTLGPASEAGIYGEPYGESFASSTSDQTIVRLPSYGQGVEGNVSGEISGLIDKSLGGIPVYDGNWTLTVDGSYVPPMESIAQASPALATGTNIPPGLLQWTGQTQIEATYTVVDQGMLGVANNLMFVFAILLGVAGAGVLGSLQGIIHVLLSRDTSGDKTHDAPQPRPKDAT